MQGKGIVVPEWVLDEIRSGTVNAKEGLILAYLGSLGWQTSIFNREIAAWMDCSVSYVNYIVRKLKDKELIEITVSDSYRRTIRTRGGE